MRILVASVLNCLLATAFVLPTTPALAQTPEATAQSSQPKPSEESIRRLLEVLQARKLVESMAVQVDAMFKGMLEKQLQGKNLTPEQQRIIQARQKKVTDLFKELFNWESMEPIYFKVYGDTFTQPEIDGMTAFYSSPTGHAVVEKLPLAMRASMTEMQQRVKEMLPKLEQMAKEAADEVKDKDAGKSDSKKTG